MRRALELFGLRESAADDDALAVSLLASFALMLLAGLGPREGGPLGTWWSLFGVALMALLVAKAMRPQRHWAVKAVAGVAVVTFTPLGIALLLGSEPAGGSLAALVAVPLASASAVVLASRREVAARRAG